MAPLLKSSGGSVVLYDDPNLRTTQPAPALLIQTYTIENFLSGSVPDKIRFVLDNRFIDRAVEDLLDNSDVDQDKLVRNAAGYVEISVPEVEEGEELVIEENYYISAMMRHRLFRAEVVDDIVDTEFREFA